MERYRKDFPALTRSRDGKPVIYFDNACTTLVPAPVIAALKQYYTDFPSCGGRRSRHWFADEVAARRKDTRQTVAEFINEFVSILQNPTNSDTEIMMSIENLTFTEKFDLLGCIQCGRCTGGCPVTVRTNLNVRRFVYDAYTAEKLEELARRVELWDCSTCNTCAVRCPKGLKPLDVLIGLRSLLVESGKIQPPIRDALESVFREGNPWGKPEAARYDWQKGLEVKIATPDKPVDNLFFVCCTIAYDPRVQVIARNTVKLLNRAGVDYGFLSRGETCCGSEVRTLGEEYLFEELVEQNTLFLNQFQAGRLVALSPHCYATLKNFYSGLKIPVMHYTQFLAEILVKEQFETGSIDKKVVFHDPCYLGKLGGIYDEPRTLLKRLGSDLLEFERSRERSLCCEGGGGKMWVESNSRHERLAETRIREAHTLGAELVAVACPFCLLTLEDAVKALGYEAGIQVVDITELLSPL